MSDTRSPYCTCEDWTPCGCSEMLQDPHCTYCCKSLSDEQLAKWQADDPELYDLLVNDKGEVHDDDALA